MNQESYTYYRGAKDRYIFVSKGRKHIQKAVQFEPTSHRHIMNMGFGDQMPDGSIDDAINSNNGDRISVLATVIEILKDYTTHHPKMEILIAGSTPLRTRLYTRILKTYYHEFSRDFHITSIISVDITTKRVPFDPSLNAEYLAFIIKRIY